MPIGIDWGGTQIKGAVVERERVLSRRSVETPIGETPAAALDAIAALVRRLASGPDPVGVAIPGEVRDHGRCWRLPNVPVSMESILPARLRAASGAGSAWRTMPLPPRSREVASENTPA